MGLGLPLSDVRNLQLHSLPLRLETFDAGEEGFRVLPILIRPYGGFA